MKTRYKSLILVFIIVFIGLLGIISITNASTDLTYTFENNLVYNSSNPTYNSTFNIRNDTSITGNYNATYSFIDETTGDEGTDIDFIDIYNTGANSHMKIIAELDGHEKVLECYDYDALEIYEGWNIFSSSQTTFTIEYWIKVENVISDSAYFEFYDGVNRRIIFAVYESFFAYYDTTWRFVIGAVNNIWYRVRLDINCTSNTMDIIINGVLEKSSAPFFSNSISLDRIKIYSHISGVVNENVWYDGFGYSWDIYYNINDNIVPIITTSDKKTVNCYEFALEDINDFYDDGEGNPSGWQTTASGNAATNIIEGNDPDNDREIQTSVINSGSIGGIQKTDFSYWTEKLNVSMGFRYTTMSDTVGGTFIEIHAQDSTLVVQLILYGDGRLGYTKSGFNQLRNDLSFTDYYDLNFFIDYGSDTCLLRYCVNDIFIENYFFPLITSLKQGLGEIDFECRVLSSAQIICMIDYVGYFGEGHAKSYEYGFLTIDLEFDEWNPQRQNLFSITSSGEYVIYVNQDVYSVESTDFQNIKPEYYYDNRDYLHNLYDDGLNEITNPFLVIYLIDLNYVNNITYLNIEGIKLTEGLNEYFLDFTYGNVNIDESYFYVSSGVLYYTLTFDDSNLEYIQATFNISNVFGENRSARFRSDANGVYAEMRFVYSDSTFTALELPISYYSKNIILNQGKTLVAFVLLASDNDQFNAGTITGRVSTITLQWIPNLFITITTLNLLGMFIVLIVIVLPTIVVAGRVGEKAIIPMLFLMSLFCAVASLIPMWLFVVISISLGSLYMVRSKVKGGSV